MGAASGVLQRKHNNWGIILSSSVIVQRVSKTYPGRSGPPVVAIEDVSLRVKPGEFFALLGPSGCGKSTLLSLIAGLDSPDPGSGAIEVGGRRVEAPLDDIALMFQNPVLLPWKTSLDNVLLPKASQSWSRPSDAERKDARDALESVGLQDFVDSYPWELSGGMQRRVSLARIIYQDTNVLLMDEPFAALDEFTRFSLNVLLRRVVKDSGQTVVLVTHNVEEAVLLANRIGVLSPRPGRLRHVMDVDLPDHRDESTMTTEEFAEAVRRLRTILTEMHVGTEGA